MDNRHPFIRRLFDWQVVLGVILITLSAVVYYFHYLLFHDVHHIFLYLISDIAFLFIEVFLVTIVIHRILAIREKRAMLKKMNMVIGAFFSEVGTELIRIFSSFDPGAAATAKELVVSAGWSPKDFAAARKSAGGRSCAVDCKRGDLACLKEFLLAKRQFLLGLLENANLLEHETFTNLLWAVFHLTEELASRKDFKASEQADYDHIAGDIKRAYALLVSEWLAYMAHLKTDYPYLFSLAVRTNPFDPNASVVILK